MSVKSIVPLDHVQIVGNGEVVAEIPLAAGRAERHRQRPARDQEERLVPAARLRAIARATRCSTCSRWATTSPIYVSVKGAPARSKPDADYFLAWVARAEAAAREHPGYNTEAEKQAVLGLARARRAAVFRQRSADAAFAAKR